MTPDGDILVVNCGSSSVKLGVFDANASRRIWSAGIERIGRVEARLHSSNGDDPSAHKDRRIPDHDTALRILFDAVSHRAPNSPLGAVGHRVVHGGQAFDRPLILCPEMEAQLRELVPLAPLHMPHNLAGIIAARRVWPSLPQIACFDTMFHRTLPPRAAMMALPRPLFDRGVRRYGFHGLSYEFIVDALRTAGVDIVRERIIIAHLGAGASMCALQGGKSIETTMGFSTLSGMPMSSRCGDIDPGAILHLLIDGGLSSEQLQHMLYRESGLLALSGLSDDMRELLARAGDTRAVAAIDFFCYQARRHIGGLAAALGGLDRLVFTGGIGANAPVVRAKICADLGFLGMALDERQNLGSSRRLSSEGSSVTVEALPTDEELIIARHIRQVRGSAHRE